MDDTLRWMPCECPYDDHRHRSFPGPAHWPAERFVVQQCHAIFRERSGRDPSYDELAVVLTATTGERSISETMLDNAINFGTVRRARSGDIVAGDGIPLRLLCPSAE